jgi:hypothetical protein
VVVMFVLEFGGDRVSSNYDSVELSDHIRAPSGFICVGGVVGLWWVATLLVW